MLVPCPLWSVASTYAYPICTHIQWHPHMHIPYAHIYSDLHFTFLLSIKLCFCLVRLDMNISAVALFIRFIWNASRDICDKDITRHKVVHVLDLSEGPDRQEIFTLKTFGLLILYNFQFTIKHGQLNGFECTWAIGFVMCSEQWTGYRTGAWDKWE